MKKLKLIAPTLIGLVSLSPLITATSCNKQTLTIVGVDSIRVGESAQYTIAEDIEVTWILDGESGKLATIQQDGTVTAKVVGKINVIALSKDGTVHSSKVVEILSNQEQNIIPESLLDIDNNGDLLGFKAVPFDLSQYDTLCIPARVTRVLSSAFFDGYVSVLPDNIKNLTYEKIYETHGDYVFEKMSKCAKIESHAFQWSPFVNVTLPYGTRTIEEFAFAFSKVENCYFPPYLNYIGDNSFQGTELKAVTFHEQREYEVWKEGQHAPEIEKGEYEGHPSLWYYGDIIPDSIVTYVGKKAFFNCDQLQYHRVTPYGQAYTSSDPSVSGDVSKSPFSNQTSTQHEHGESNLFQVDFSAYFKENGWDHYKLPDDFTSAFGIPTSDFEWATEKFRCIGMSGWYIEQQGPNDGLYSQIARRLKVVEEGLSKEQELDGFFTADGNKFCANSTLRKKQIYAGPDDTLPTLIHMEIPKATLKNTQYYIDKNTSELLAELRGKGQEFDIKCTVIPETIKWDDDEGIELSVKDGGSTPERRYLQIEWSRWPSRSNSVKFEVQVDCPELGIHERLGNHPCWQNESLSYDNSIQIDFNI